ncbi:hypothetical protein Fcan01_20122 [Folsomia candida]|uniref:Uncharacterized protein n=1 Tax=Folsomia candida TaxID=158441 RepID=A0A226DLD6_FOLCA|nr:hypothetical protein Fcan01_20122 [Folsomia candida]
MEAKLMKLLIQLTFFTAFFVSLSIPCLLLLDPLSPPFILSMKKDWGNICWTSGLGFQHLVILLEAYMAMHIVVGGSVEISYVLIAGIVTLLNYFDVLRREIQTAQRAAEFKCCIELYRNIQILEKMFNGVLMYICVMMHDEIPMPAYLIFPLVLLNCLGNNIFIFTFASWVNNVSTRTLREQLMGMGRCGWGKRRSILSKEAKACTVLKIKFGSNFIDRGTPLVIQDFCLTQTMSLILIDESIKGC